MRIDIIEATLRTYLRGRLSELSSVSHEHGLSSPVLAVMMEIEAQVQGFRAVGLLNSYEADQYSTAIKATVFGGEGEG